MSVKKILKELLEDNPDYSGRWDMDFKMDLQTKNHIRLVRLCQLLGFEDLYDLCSNSLHLTIVLNVEGS